MNACRQRPRKCKNCGHPFRPWNTLQRCCGVQCAIDHAQREADKKFRAETRERKLAIKTRADWMKEAQQAFNAYIRTRDESQPCISCGNANPGGDPCGGLWDCSHYRSVGACPELRFEPLNAHRACKNCNRDKSGNIVEYRIRLEKKIGTMNLAWLEGHHEPKKYTIDDLKALKLYYQRLSKELKQRRAA